MPQAIKLHRNAAKDIDGPIFKAREIALRRIYIPGELKGKIEIRVTPSAVEILEIKKKNKKRF